MACDKCAAFGGLWMETPRGLRRCDCAAGRRLSEPPKSHPPVLTDKQTTAFVEMLGSIPYFPGERGARIAIGEEVRAMCAGPKEALWLVTRMRRLFQQWPGPIAMRHVYYAKYMPLDGERPIGMLEAYPDGIPAEAESALPQLPAAPPIALLGDGRKHEVVADPKIATAVKRLAASMPAMPSGRPTGGRFERTLQEALTAPQDRPELPAPTKQVITREDCDREVAKLHAAKEEQIA